MEDVIKQLRSKVVPFKYGEPPIQHPKKINKTELWAKAQKLEL